MEPRRESSSGGLSMSNPSAITTRSLRTGEVLLKPGDKVRNIYLLQSGRMALGQVKSEKFVEIAQLAAGQSIGDEAAFGPLQWNLIAIAIRDTVLIEVPVDAITTPLNQAPPMLKTLLKALGDRLKSSFNEVKALRLGRETLPCPPDHVAKVFGVIYHGAKMNGQVSESGADATVDWDELRKFAVEVFNESVVRLEDAVGILTKLGYARFEERKLHLTDLKQVEAFFDYYGNYHFKGGYADLLKTNSKMQKVTEEFLKIADQHPMDRGGNAHLPYKPTIDAMKKAMGGSFEADQLFRLEQKGLFIKRTATQDGGILSFYRPDFDQMMLNWKLLREIELWNEKGFVDATVVPSGKDPMLPPFDPVEERKKWAKALEGWKPATLAGPASALKLRAGERPPAGETWCEVCMGVLERGAKSCPVCGADVKAKAA
jgi:CRP-like cAMP-binding protein